MKINELINKRYSPRAFSEKPVEKEKLRLIFEAAGLAASSYNSQPWRFIYAEKDKSGHYEKLLSSLSEFNSQWASKAPVLILTLAKKTYEHNGKDHIFAAYDLGLAIGNLTLQAGDLGLYLHQMGGFSKDKIREDFKISNDFDIVTIIALGYLGNTEDLPEELKKIENKPRERKGLSEIISDQGFIW